MSPWRARSLTHPGNVRSRTSGFALEFVHGSQRYVRLGNFGDSKRVGDGIFELRIHTGAGYRIYYGREGDRVVILLCGGDKGTQKRDIQRAEEYWRDYRSQEHDQS